MAKKDNTNALKHGSFAKIVVFPGEDYAEFEDLHNSLIEEWNPDGASEHENVAALAHDIWRTSRLRRCRYNHAAKIAHLCWERDLDLMASVADFLHEVHSGSLGAITEQELLEKLLRLGATRYIPLSIYKKMLAREMFETDAAWLNAVVESYLETMLHFADLISKERRHPQRARHCPTGLH